MKEDGGFTDTTNGCGTMDSGGRGPRTHGMEATDGSVGIRNGELIYSGFLGHKSDMRRDRQGRQPQQGTEKTEMWKEGKGKENGQEPQSRRRISA